MTGWAGLALGAFLVGTCNNMPTEVAPTVSNDDTSAPAVELAAAPAETVIKVLEGHAIWYGDNWHGRKTASGERFDKRAMTAAHRNLPLGSRVRVTNLANGRSDTVRVVDRGPAESLRAAGLIIDVSRRAAEVLQFVQQGRTRVRVEVLDWGDR